MCNKDIKERAKVKGIPLWMIAEKFGITDTQFSRWLRHEFTPERKKQAFEFIEVISSEISAGNQKP